jgi:hypothetical protein
MIQTQIVVAATHQLKFTCRAPSAHRIVVAMARLGVEYNRLIWTTSPSLLGFPTCPAMNAFAHCISEQQMHGRVGKRLASSRRRSGAASSASLLHLADGAAALPCVNVSTMAISTGVSPARRSRVASASALVTCDVRSSAGRAAPKRPNFRRLICTPSLRDRWSRVAPTVQFCSNTEVPAMLIGNLRPPKLGRLNGSVKGCSR